MVWVFSKTGVVGRRGTSSGMAVEGEMENDSDADVLTEAEAEMEML